MAFLTTISLAQTVIDLGPIETIAFKLLALVTMILWACYLVKDLFFGHREDPRLAALMATMSQTTTQLAVLSENSRHLTEAIADQKRREDKMWDQMAAISRTLTTLSNDQHLMEGATIAAAGLPNPLRSSIPRK
jgi:hypothetical protein